MKIDPHSTGSVSQRDLTEWYNFVEGGGGGGSVETTIVVRRALTQAEVRALYTTPIQVVTGVAGTLVVPKMLTMRFTGTAGCPTITPRIGWLYDGGIVNFSNTVTLGVGLSYVCFFCGAEMAPGLTVGTGVQVKFRDSTPDPSTVIGTGEVLLEYVTFTP